MAVWRVDIAPGTPATPHSLTREEVFVVLDGQASVEIDGVCASAGPGDAIVVPAEVEFALSNEQDQPLRLLCCLPVGGQGRIAGGDPFTPPWAQ
jgi:mannose-6-phosphate isomerase-like protein (cupin superfamily)